MKPQTLKEKLRTRYALFCQVYRTLPEEVRDKHREMVGKNRGHSRKVCRTSSHPEMNMEFRSDK
jgi:hypothetical protein